MREFLQVHVDSSEDGMLKVADVCIGDQVLLTNKLVGTVEFIGTLHDFNQIEAIDDINPIHDDDDDANVEQKM